MTDTENTTSTPAAPAPAPVASKANTKAHPAAPKKTSAARTKPAAVKPVAKSAAKPSPTAKAAATPKAEKPEKVKKPKMVRDSLSIPKHEYAVLDVLKLRAAKLASPAKKTELIRAGIKALAAMSEAAFLAAVKAVPSLKTGRPAGKKKH